MQGATHRHTCRSACFGCMRRDISCLADPPRASTCQAALTPPEAQPGQLRPGAYL
ncbi:unnamed protein product [Brassica rapa subsp. trilocularis]